MSDPNVVIPVKTARVVLNVLMTVGAQINLIRIASKSQIENYESTV
jgi:hypothetical protein